MADFDAIVVGSGCAGSVAAYEIAKAGKSVLVVERGNFAGAKNMTGGRIYGHCLRAVFPDNFDEIPFERKVSHERISLMSPSSNFTIDFASEDLLKDGQESYTVLRAPFDQWLAEQAENAGAEYICGIAVEKLIKDENGKVIGIFAGEDEITADVVVLCDGANSLLVEQAVGAKLVEHSGHLVPEGGITTMPELTADGVMIAGDNATMCVNLGYTVRGMDYAVASGQMAGQAAVKALDAGDTSKAGLKCYVDALEDSFVMKDMRQFKNVPDFMEHFDRMFCGYPEMIRDMMNTMFVVDGSPVQPMKKSMMPIVKGVGFMNLFKDVKGAMKAL